jgi:hypothetical protein
MVTGQSIVERLEKLEEQNRQLNRAGAEPSSNVISPRQMKQLFRNLTTILAGVLLVTSCQKPSDSAGKANSVDLSHHDDRNAPYRIRKDGKFGFIDETGSILIEPQFDLAEEFSEGLAAVCVGPCKFVDTDEKESGETLNVQRWEGKWGFIDTKGKMVINPRFTKVGSFYRGKATFSLDDFLLFKESATMQEGYIDKTGTVVIPSQFWSADKFEDDGLAVACVGDRDSRRCGCLGEDGKFVINPQFNEANPFRGPLAEVQVNKLDDRSYIDRSGKIVWQGRSIRDLFSTQ